jgi:isocitrate dehydrogenase
MFIKEEAQAIRTAVNKSLEQGIVTEDLAKRVLPFIKQVMWRLASCQFVEASDCK